MRRRSCQLALLWLLPLLIARALVPSGFMLGAGANGFGLMLCPGEISITASSEHADHAQHAGHNDHASHQNDHQSAPCPFALGACGASIDIAWLASVAASPIDETANSSPIVGSGIEALRSHPIRGPPRFS